MVSEEQNSEIELASEVVPVPQVPPQIVVSEVEDVNNDVNNEDNEANDNTNGYTRRRKRSLYAAILKQMEFYFSDSNLNKDRFLAGLIKENPNIDIEIFLRFNKIRTLTTDIKRIIKALKNSKILKVSDDGTKICRITPIVEKQNIDECTVYVQRLPSDADHEWLTTLFSEYGKVAYVSIPKFKYNNKIKGFAFVEFETPEEAEKCLKAFRAKGCELPSQTSPTDVLSITTFTEDEKQENGSKIPKKVKDEEFLESEEPKSKKKKKTKPAKSNIKEFETDKGNIKKEKIDSLNEEKQEQSGVENDTDKETNEEKSKRKRKKRSIDHKDSENDHTEQSQNKIKKTKIDKLGDSSLCLSDPNTEGEEKSGKKRKHRPSSEGVQESENESHDFHLDCKKRKKKIEDSEKEVSEENTLKNESDVKQEIKEEAVENEDEKEKRKKKKRKRNHHSHEVIETVDLGLQVMGKKSWKKLRNKYLDLQKAKMKQLKQHIRKARWNQWGKKMDCEQEEIGNNKKENPASNLEFTPGVILKMELNQTCVDPKSFKAELKSHCNNIKYIDIKEGSNVAFVRCDSSETATTLSQETNEKSCEVLKGDEEKSYWDKIMTDRKEKINNKTHVNRRGRHKLLKKAEKELGKHIRFDEV